ncbi:hypothetical protein H5410_026853 [Solanum commersonii]|uniref:Uncharacterized protein n=1 Tax=Solanum commersonii TaxID=4109 RepID=A0A9J5YXN9_SOLCO|nr:hypothetical protein H5410_026853 [Solanum commersonii]
MELTRGRRSDEVIAVKDLGYTWQAKLYNWKDRNALFYDTDMLRSCVLIVIYHRVEVSLKLIKARQI